MSSIRKNFLIYSIVDKAFEEFVVNNLRILQDIPHGSLLHLATVANLCNLSLLSPPYNIAFIGRDRTLDGDVYHFLSNKFENIYQYFDIT